MGAVEVGAVASPSGRCFWRAYNVAAPVKVVVAGRLEMDVSSTPLAGSPAPAWRGIGDVEATVSTMSAVQTQGVGRTLDSQSSALKHVSVDHCRRHANMTE